MSKKTRRPTGEPRSKRALSRETGVSRPFMWRAEQVAKIPEAEFEKMVESENPPTVSQLVTYGRTGKLSRPRKVRQKPARCPHCGGVL